MADRSNYKYVAADDEKAALEAVKSILPHDEVEASNDLVTDHLSLFLKFCCQKYTTSIL